MNEKGLEYIAEIKSKWNSFQGKRSFSISDITERAMRLGVENRIFKMENKDEIEEIALWTLREDLMKNS